MEELEEWGTEVIFGRARGFRASIMRGVLSLLSLLFGGIIRLRLSMYRTRLLRQQMMGVLVISVGNITVGGTGKTPVVELLSKTLRDHNRRIAILTRGYKSENMRKEQMWKDINGKRVRNVPKIASDGKTRYLDPLYAGDEPFMLAKNLDNVAVLVDKNRIKSSIFAVEQLNCNTLILDDGMQYMKLAHEIDIVLVDCNAPFGTGAMLPRGTMREPKSSLSRADYIILTKSEGKPQEELISQIRKYNQVAGISVSDHGPKYLQNVFTGERLPLDKLKDKWVACLSGIARPESFENSVRALGANVDIIRRFPDHHWFNEDELEQFYERCSNRAMQMIVTTEKDAVRLSLPKDNDVPIYFLRIEVDIHEGKEEWDDFIRRICTYNTSIPLHEWAI